MGWSSDSGCQGTGFDSRLAQVTFGHFLVMSGSLFRIFLDMLGCVWGVFLDMFGWVWEGFEKKLGKCRKMSKNKSSGI